MTPYQTDMKAISIESSRLAEKIDHALPYIAQFNSPPSFPPMMPTVNPDSIKVLMEGVSYLLKIQALDYEERSRTRVGNLEEFMRGVIKEINDVGQR